MTSGDTHSRPIWSQPKTIQALDGDCLAVNGLLGVLAPLWRVLTMSRWVNPSLPDAARNESMSLRAIR